MSDLQCPEDSAFHPEQLRSTDDQSRQVACVSSQIDCVEYVNMIRDLRKLDQNVCLCRHFHNFDKKTILRRIKSREEVFVDAWPVNLFDNSCHWSPEDVTSQFLLQLSTVILMTQHLRGKSIALRVFLSVSSRLAADTITRLHDSLHTSLLNMRIRGKIVLRVLDELCGDVGDVTSASESYVKSLNLRIREECANTALVYMYLPLPRPAAAVSADSTSSSNGDSSERTYVQRLTALTDGLPPTVLVHGVSRVTTTAL